MSIILDWNNNQSQFEISDEWIEKLTAILQIAAENEGLTSGEVTLTFTNNEDIQELNKQYRNIDKPTDVLSFALNDDGVDELNIIFEVESENDIDPISGMLGDIIISVERAEEQRIEYGHSLEREIGFLFVHGFLHLLGYDHQDDEAEAVMTQKQEAVLQQVGLTR